MSAEIIHVVSGTPYDGFLAAEVSRLEQAQPSKNHLIALGRLFRLMDALRPRAEAVIIPLEMAACDVAIAWAPFMPDLIDFDQVVGGLSALAKRPGAARDRRLADSIVLRDDAESLVHALGQAGALLPDQYGLERSCQTLQKRLHEIDQELSALAFDPWSLPPPADAVPDILVWIAIEELTELCPWSSASLLPLAIQPTGLEHRTTLDKWAAWTFSVTLTKSAHLRLPRSIQKRLQTLRSFDGYPPR